MYNLEIEEVEELKIPKRKGIRKVKRFEEDSVSKQSAISADTLPEAPTEVIPNYQSPISQPINSIKIIKKPVVTPALRSILNGVSITSESKVHKENKHIVLRDGRKGKKRQEFKLYKERDLPLFSQAITQIPLNEPGYDNDDDTDNEQIKNGIRIMEGSIIEALSNIL